MSDFDLSCFATSQSKENEGTLTTLPGCGATLWRIARMGNATYNRLLSNAYKLHKTALAADTPAAEAKGNELLAEIYAGSILLGWQGEIPFQGKKHTYSKALATTLLKMKDFRALVEAAASDYNTFREAQEAQELGN